MTYSVAVPVAVIFSKQKRYILIAYHLVFYTSIFAVRRGFHFDRDRDRDRDRE